MSNCFVCNSVIKSNRRGKKYCSNACKQRAYYARKNQNKQPIQQSRKLFPYHEYLEHRKELEQNNIDMDYLEYCYFRSLCPQGEVNSDNLVPFIVDLNESLRVSNLKSARELDEKMHQAIIDLLFE